MKIDTPDLKTGFWVALGVLLAVALWHFLSHLISRAGRRDG